MKYSCFIWPDPEIDSGIWLLSYRTRLGVLVTRQFASLWDADNWAEANNCDMRQFMECLDLMPFGLLMRGDYSNEKKNVQYSADQDENLAASVYMFSPKRKPPQD